MYALTLDTDCCTDCSQCENYLEGFGEAVRAAKNNTLLVSPANMHKEGGRITRARNSCPSSAINLSEFRGN